MQVGSEANCTKVPYLDSYRYKSQPLIGIYRIFAAGILQTKRGSRSQILRCLSGIRSAIRQYLWQTRCSRLWIASMLNMLFLLEMSSKASIFFSPLFWFTDSLRLGAIWLTTQEQVPAFLLAFSAVQCVYSFQWSNIRSHWLQCGDVIENHCPNISCHWCVVFCSRFSTCKVILVCRKSVSRSSDVYTCAQNLVRSDSTPVNSFPRNTTDTTLDVQWVFDTQSAGWEVRWAVVPYSWELVVRWYHCPESIGLVTRLVNKSTTSQAVMQPLCPVWT